MRAKKQETRAKSQETRSKNREREIRTKANFYDYIGEARIKTCQPEGSISGVPENREIKNH